MVTIKCITIINTYMTCISNSSNAIMALNFVQFYVRCVMHDFNLVSIACYLVSRMNKAVEVQAKAKITLEGVMKHSPSKFAVIK